MYYQFESDLYENTYAHFLEWIQEAIQKTFEEERLLRGLAQADIARALKVDASVVSRRINGGGNITLKTISDLYTAMGREPLANFRPPVHRHTHANRLASAVSNPTVIVFIHGPGHTPHHGFSDRVGSAFNSSEVSVSMVNNRWGATVGGSPWPVPAFSPNITIDVKPEEAASG